MAPCRLLTPVGCLFGVCPVESCNAPMLKHLLRALLCPEISQAYPRWLP